MRLLVALLLFSSVTAAEGEDFSGVVEGSGEVSDAPMTSQETPFLTTPPANESTEEEAEKIHGFIDLGEILPLGINKSRVEQIQGLPDLPDLPDPGLFPEESTTTLAPTLPPVAAPDPSCEPDELRCAGESRCINAVWRCDGSDDCSDGSDERSCDQETFLDFDSQLNCSDSRFRYCKGDPSPLCYPRAYWCDDTIDCINSDDEHGCQSPSVEKDPPRRVQARPGETRSFSCTVGGNPPPTVVWRLNWGHVDHSRTSMDSRLSGTSVVGRITLRDIQCEDAGAYSCQAVSARGRVFARDTMLEVSPCGAALLAEQCRVGEYNSAPAEAPAPSCRACYCSGVSNQCIRGDFTTSRRHVLYNQEVEIQASMTEFSVITLVKNSLLMSYGGWILWDVESPESSGSLRGNRRRIGDVLIEGLKGKVAAHVDTEYAPERRQYKVQLLEENFRDVSSGATVTKEKLFQVLQFVERIIFYAPLFQSQRSLILWDAWYESAEKGGRGEANHYIPECECGERYTGPMCQDCAPGYKRDTTSSRHLGTCVPV